jgi:hypothetical protein
MKSKLDIWFKEQFGARPGGNKSHETLLKDLQKKQYAFMEAGRLLRQREEYDKDKSCLIRLECERTNETK